MPISAGITPWGQVSFDSLSGDLYVDNFYNNTVTEYDQNGNQITTSGSFPNLDWPAGIAFDSANGSLYVSSGYSSTITEYDQNGNQVTPSGTFPNLSNPQQLVVVLGGSPNFGRAKIHKR